MKVKISMEEKIKRNEVSRIKKAARKSYKIYEKGRVFAL